MKRFLLALFCSSMALWAGMTTKDSAQADFLSGKYLDAAQKFSAYASQGDHGQKVEGLYWESMSRFDAVEKGEELLSRADSVCQLLLVTAKSDDSLQFAGQMLSAYMALKKDPTLALRRFEASSKRVPTAQKARYYWVGYLIYAKNRNLSKAQNFKTSLLKDYPNSPEAANLKDLDPDSRVAELKSKPRVAPKRGQTVVLKTDNQPTEIQPVDEAQKATLISSSSAKIKVPDLGDESSSSVVQSASSSKASADRALAIQKAKEKQEKEVQARRQRELKAAQALKIKKAKEREQEDADDDDDQAVKSKSKIKAKSKVQDDDDDDDDQDQADNQTGSFFLQLGSFPAKTNAEKHVKNLASKAKINNAKIVQQGGAYKVRLFGFKDRKSAEDFAKKKVKPKGFDALVVQQKKP